MSFDHEQALCATPPSSATGRTDAGGASAPDRERAIALLLAFFDELLTALLGPALAAKLMEGLVAAFESLRLAGEDSVNSVAAAPASECPRLRNAGQGSATIGSIRAPRTRPHAAPEIHFSESEASTSATPLVATPSHLHNVVSVAMPPATYATASSAPPISKKDHPTVSHIHA